MDDSKEEPEVADVDDWVTPWEYEMWTMMQTPVFPLSRFPLTDQSVTEVSGFPMVTLLVSHREKTDLQHK